MATAARLTPLSRILITLLIIAAIVLGGKWVLENTEIGKSLGLLDGGNDTTEQVVDNNSNRDNETRPSNNNNTNSNSGKTVRVGVVTWGGYAGGQYFNEGFAASQKSRFYRDYGFNVEFVLNDDPVSSLEAWKNGDLDLHWYTIDAFPCIAEGIKDFDPVAVLQADWSRGGDAIVVRRGINSVADLKGKKIAVAEQTPSHSFLIWLLDAGGLKATDVTIIGQPSAVEAADAFKAQRVDAAVVWSPDDIACVRSVTGSKVLENTTSASNIIADFFFAKKDWVEKNRKMVDQLYEGWMIGAKEINESSTNKAKAGKILEDKFSLPKGDGVAMIDNVRLATHGDNMNFFGLNPNYNGVTAEQLYSRMTTEYTNLGIINRAPTYRAVSYPAIARSANLSGAGHSAEKGKDFTKVTENEGREKEAIASKPVSIAFPTGSATLSENAKYIIDREFLQIAKAFANARIRIEGNTDSTGSRSSNIKLSKRRAMAVRDYMVNEHRMNPNRLIVIGNGPDNPVATNDTDAGRAKNRRTDFQLVRD